MAVNLKVVATFATLWEAGMAKSVLEDAGVPAMIDGETTASIAPFSEFWRRGARLLVPEDQLDRAVEVIEEWHAAEDIPPDPPEGDL